LFPARGFFPRGTTARLLTPAALLALLFPVVDARAQAANAACENPSELAVLSSPIAPWKGAPLRVMFAAEKSYEGELSLIAPDGSVVATSRERHGGPPYFWTAETASPVPGQWQAKLVREGAEASCATVTRQITVRADEPPRPHATEGTLWPLRTTWNRGTENLYSAWIEKLFDAPLDASPSWPALHEVLRDKSRNFLFNHLGLREDQLGQVVRPDCADLPYFLRAYFAFKMGLPFGYSKCTRGGGGHAPKCHDFWSIQNPEPPRAAPVDPRTASGMPIGPGMVMPEIMRPAATPATVLASARQMGLAAAFGRYLGAVGDGVHSGSGRTALNDDQTDSYPVPLTQETLRPGTVYADPYGHLLVIAKRVPQTEGAAGVFLAVDGQPDGTVARKRFWRGNFLFAQDPALGGPGFKRFRPIVRNGNGNLRRLTNNEIASNAEYGDFSLEQGKLGVEEFYDRMDDVMSPAPLDPLRAMKEAITSLEEQVKTRVVSVENGRKFQATGRGSADMPDGAAIFETTGAWEDFSTPARDLRLLIALDVVRGFPDRVARRTDRFAMPKDKSVAEVKAELETVLATELATRKFSYTRSDGSAWTLALKDVMDRAAALEMAYNPNDCVELRWGAVEKSDEAATCTRRAPSGQRAKMADYRAWFHDRRRPPRG
jgi:hypothetical protein